jgi:hypothetical protein
LLIIAGINPEALQLTTLLLPQYESKLIRVLKDSEEYPLPGIDIELEIKVELVPQIIAAIIELGERWLAQKHSNEDEKNRDALRQRCIHIVLNEWIKIGDECR